MKHFTVTSEDIQRCPDKAWAASHYRVDGSCLHLPGVDVKIEQAYSDGHTSFHMVTLQQPTAEQLAGDWWEEVIAPWCGDGHGAIAGLGYCYTATITKADDAKLVGLSNEWSGR